jgi:hypothetical protein
MPQVTRLGLHGGPRGLYGSFAGRTENVVVATATTTGGGKSKRQRQRRYPRWVVVDGERYQVWSPEDEENLLRQLQQQFAEEAVKLEGAGKTAEAQTARRKAVRVAKRVDKVPDAVTNWKEFLKREDEEVLEVFMTLH